MKTCSEYQEIVSACELFQETRKLEPLEELIPQARLYVYGFRSLTGYLDRIKQDIEGLVKASPKEDLWFLRQALNQLYELDVFMHQEVPIDFRTIVVYFNFYSRTLHAIEEILEKSCRASMTMRNYVKSIYDRFVRAVELVTKGCGIYTSNWKDIDENATLYIPDVGITIVKLIYANRHSCNLAIIPDKVNTHKHRETSEIHFGLEPTDGDQIVRGFRIRVTEPYAVPIRPGEWHGFEENRSKEPHRLLFLTGSPRILGWNVVNDRSITAASELKLKAISSDEIGLAGGVLLQREIESIESSLSNRANQRELIGYEATHGITLNVLGIPDSYDGVSNDVIFLVVKGEGQLKVEHSEVRIRDGDVFAVPYNMEYTLKREGTLPLILLSSALES